LEHDFLTQRVDYPLHTTLKSWNVTCLNDECKSWLESLALERTIHWYCTQ